MNRQAKYYFEGRLSTGRLRQAEVYEVGELVEYLNAQRAEIEDQLRSEISTRLRTSVSTEIEFDEGSLEWFGWIEVTWDVLEAMSTIGGAIGLVGILGAAVSRVLRRWLPDQIAGRVYTRVRVVETPVSQTSEAVSQSWRQHAVLYLLLASNLVVLVVVIVLLVNLV